MWKNDRRLVPADGTDPCHAGGGALPGNGAQWELATCGSGLVRVRSYSVTRSRTGSRALVPVAARGLTPG